MQWTMQTVSLIWGILSIVGMLVSDILLALIDPRIRYR